jgi:hypothetical protein
MSMLDYTIETEVEFLDSDPSDAAFIQVTTTIRGHDSIEELVACKMYPLTSSFGFRGVTIGTTPMLNTRTPLPLFPEANISAENVAHVLTEIEMEAERILGSFGPKEHDALNTAKIMNGGCVNRVLEQMGVS